MSENTNSLINCYNKTDDLGQFFVCLYIDNASIYSYIRQVCQYMWNTKSDFYLQEGREVD